MARTLIPMVHVPEVGAAVAWYRDLGFEVLGTHEEDGDLDWAMLGWGEGRLMFNEGGRASDARRREVDLYLYVEDVDALHREVAGRVEVVEAPHDTVYGMRELIVRDLNRFWITFGQPTAA